MLFKFFSFNFIRFNFPQFLPQNYYKFYNCYAIYADKVGLLKTANQKYAYQIHYRPVDSQQKYHRKIFTFPRALCILNSITTFRTYCKLMGILWSVMFEILLPNSNISISNITDMKIHVAITLSIKSVAPSVPEQVIEYKVDIAVV